MITSCRRLGALNITRIDTCYNNRSYRNFCEHVYEAKIFARVTVQHLILDEKFLNKSFSCLCICCCYICYKVAPISDFGPFLIIAFLEYFTFSVFEKIIKNAKSENRIAISFAILVLWPKVCNGVVIFVYGFSH